MDAKYLEQTFIRMRPGMIRYITKLSKNPDLAEEIVQDTFLQIWRIRATLYKDRIEHLIKMCARHKFLSHTKHEKLVHENSSFFYRDDECSPTQDMTVLIKEVSAFLQIIPSPYRDALLTVTLENNTQAEAAQQIAVPVGTICSRFSRGRALLKERFK